MVNGAQGDDDEAHGGHFALVTGRVQADGSIGDWLVNNFYSLDVESEKGIIAAPVPLDNYLADLNSGQGWYRPSYMVVAVLRDERAAGAGAVGAEPRLQPVLPAPARRTTTRTRTARASASTRCARSGWSIPARGPSSRLLAWLGFPFIAMKERSIGKAKLAFDYLRTDQTRLMPAAALEEAFGSLLALGARPAVPTDAGALAHMLARGSGRARVRALSAVSVEPRVRRRARGHDVGIQGARSQRSRRSRRSCRCRRGRSLPRCATRTCCRTRWRPSDYALVVWGVLSIVGIPFVLWRVWRWRARSRRRG